MPPKSALTLQETAERLHRSPRTLEKWIRVGRLKWRLETREGEKPEVEKTITILPEKDWLTTAEAAAALKRQDRHKSRR